MKPSNLSAKQVEAIAMRHAELEAECDFEPLMETLIDEPVFEFHPPGGALIGGHTLRRYYRRFLDEFMPLVEGTAMLGATCNEDAAVHEYQLRLRVDGELQYHQVVAVLYASGDRLGGERLYGSEPLLRLMLGPMIDELVPIDGPTQFEKEL
jgi:hypothetical protein